MIEKQSPDPAKVKGSIETLENLDLRTVSMNEIDELLRPLFDRLKTRGFMFQEKYAFYRAIIYDEDPTHIDQMSFRKDTSRIKEYGRCNDIGEATFYCCTTKAGAMNEIERGWRKAYVGIWRVNENFIANNIGFTRKVKETLGSKREFDHYIPDGQRIDWYQGAMAEAYEFLSHTFTKKFAAEDENYHYKLSAAIHRSLTRGQPYGLLFPSVANNGDYDNLAIKPSFINEGKLTLVQVNRYETLFIPEDSRHMPTKTVKIQKEGRTKTIEKKRVDVTSQLRDGDFLEFHTGTGMPDKNGNIKWYIKKKISINELLDEQGYLKT